jgi:REP element-mobilizing transposase RayT
VSHSKAIEALRLIFGRVCGDFQGRLVEMDGEADHVHFLIE